MIRFALFMLGVTSIAVGIGGIQRARRKIARLQEVKLLLAEVGTVLDSVKHAKDNEQAYARLHRALEIQEHAESLLYGRTQ